MRINKLAKAAWRIMTDEVFEAVFYAGLIVLPGALFWWLIHQTHDIVWLKYSILVFGVLAILHGLMTCSIVNMFVGLGVSISAVVMVFTGRIQWLELVTIGFVLLVSMLSVYEWFRWALVSKLADLNSEEKRKYAEVERARRDALNPRCKTCHAKSICPYQPGAILDRYSSK